MYLEPVARTLAPLSVQLVLARMASAEVDADLALKMFRRVDKNGDGELSKGEVISALRKDAAVASFFAAQAGLTVHEAETPSAPGASPRSRQRKRRWSLHEGSEVGKGNLATALAWFAKADLDNSDLIDVEEWMALFVRQGSLGAAAAAAAIGRARASHPPTPRGGSRRDERATASAASSASASAPVASAPVASARWEEKVASSAHSTAERSEKVDEKMLAVHTPSPALTSIAAMRAKAHVQLAFSFAAEAEAHARDATVSVAQALDGARFTAASRAKFGVARAEHALALSLAVPGAYVPNAESMQQQEASSLHSVERLNVAEEELRRVQAWMNPAQRRNGGAGARRLPRSRPQYDGLQRDIDEVDALLRRVHGEVQTRERHQVAAAKLRIRCEAVRKLLAVARGSRVGAMSAMQGDAPTLALELCVRCEALFDECEARCIADREQESARGYAEAVIDPWGQRAFYTRRGECVELLESAEEGASLALQLLASCATACRLVLVAAGGVTRGSGRAVRLAPPVFRAINETKEALQTCAVVCAGIVRRCAAAPWTDVVVSAKNAVQAREEMLLAITSSSRPTLMPSKSNDETGRPGKGGSFAADASSARAALPRPVDALLARLQLQTSAVERESSKRRADRAKQVPLTVKARLAMIGRKAEAASVVQRAVRGHAARNPTLWVRTKPRRGRAARRRSLHAANGPSAAAAAELEEETRAAVTFQKKFRARLARMKAKNGANGARSGTSGKGGSLLSPGGGTTGGTGQSSGLRNIFGFGTGPKPTAGGGSKNGRRRSSLSGLFGGKRAKPAFEVATDADELAIQIKAATTLQTKFRRRKYGKDRDLKIRTKAATSLQAKYRAHKCRMKGDEQLVKEAAEEREQDQAAKPKGLKKFFRHIKNHGLKKKTRKKKKKMTTTTTEDGAAGETEGGDKKDAAAKKGHDEKGVTTATEKGGEKSEKDEEGKTKKKKKKKKHKHKEGGEGDGGGGDGDGDEAKVKKKKKKKHKEEG